MPRLLTKQNTPTVLFYARKRASILVFYGFFLVVIVPIALHFFQAVNDTPPGNESFWAYVLILLRPIGMMMQFSLIVLSLGMCVALVMAARRTANLAGYIANVLELTSPAGVAFTSLFVLLALLEIVTDLEFFSTSKFILVAYAGSLTKDKVGPILGGTTGSPPDYLGRK